MTSPRRQRVLLTTMAAGLAVLTIGAWRYSVAQSEAADAARDDLQAIYADTARIEQYRQRPALATGQERLADETTGIIGRAAVGAGIASGQLVIQPEPAQRIGDSSYKEKPTSVRLRGIGLEQLVKFAHAVVSGEHALRVKTIRLSAAGQDPASAWNAEIDFAYLIYEPAGEKRQP